MFYDQEEEGIIKKFESYKNNAIRNYKITLTKFLNTREQELLEFVIGKHDDVFLYFSFDSIDLEYKRAVISPFEIEPDFKIKYLKLKYNQKFVKIDHRHLLGNIMGLQIERNMIGDILISREGNVYIISSEEMSEFLIDNLRIYDHQAVELLECSELVGDFTPDYDVKKYFFNSLRLDLVISNLYNISRTVSQELIMSGNVKINQRKELNPVKNLIEGDLVSIKGHGRMKVISIGGLSKSGKTMVELAKII